MDLAGPSATVQIERDVAGVASISVASRMHVARAGGFVHAQERVLQMDLMQTLPPAPLYALPAPQGGCRDTPLQGEVLASPQRPR